MIDVATQFVLPFAACVEDGSTSPLLGDAPVAAPGRAWIVVEVEDGRATPDRAMPLSVRVVVTVSDASDVPRLLTSDRTARSFRSRSARPRRA